MTDNTYYTSVFYDRLKGALRSLKEHTDRKIALRGETVEFNGLSSPHILHRSIKVDLGHGVPGLVIISNPNYTVAVVDYCGLELYDSIKFYGPHMKGLVPSHYIRGLFMFPAKAPDWITGLVKVVMLDPFDGFNEDGTPKWVRFAELKASVRDPDRFDRTAVVDVFGSEPVSSQSSDLDYWFG